MRPIDNTRNLMAIPIQYNSFMRVAIILVGFHSQAGFCPPSFRISLDNVLINVYNRFHTMSIAQHDPNSKKYRQ
mgnify:CR=1 FL=1